MSSKIKGLRRVGIVGLSTVVAASMMSLSAVTATALPPAYTALTAPNVTRTTGQTAGTVTLDFANVFTTNASQTFTISGNNCSTAAGIAAATEFTAAAGATLGSLSTSFAAGSSTAGSGTATAPSFTSVTGSSSTACATVGIVDQVTLTLTQPSAGVATDYFKFTLPSVYNVGATAPLGNVNVATSGALRANASVVNAVVAGTTHTSPATVLAVPSAPGVGLGTQTLKENSPGSFFGAGGSTTTVLLTLSGTSTFTAAVTPVVTLPTGYTMIPASPAATTAIGTYTFQVVSPATPVAATMTVSGLTILASATATDVTLAITGGIANPAALKAVRVINYTARTGGTDRYATAAALYANTFTDTDVVLSSGVNFPDALSANYLAGQLNTGTMLTTPNTLPIIVRNTLFTENVTTVYITGGTGAVSQNVQNQIEAMHVGNVVTGPFINVVRLGGANRYATNQIINEYLFQVRSTVMIATGLNFPDSLTVGPLAEQGFPLILTQGVTLGASENAQLAEFNPTTVIIAGGTGVVSAAIATDLTARGYTVIRLSGSDRTLTAAAVATHAVTNLGFNSTTAYVTTGDNFADALAAGPVAGANDFVIMPTNSPTSLGAGIPLYFGTKTVGVTSPGSIGTTHALGLFGAVSLAVMRSAALAIG